MKRSKYWDSLKLQRSQKPFFFRLPVAAGSHQDCRFLQTFFPPCPPLLPIYNGYLVVFITFLSDPAVGIYKLSSTSCTHKCHALHFLHVPGPCHQLLHQWYGSLPAEERKEFGVNKLEACHPQFPWQCRKTRQPAALSCFTSNRGFSRISCKQRLTFEQWRQLVILAED